METAVSDIVACLFDGHLLKLGTGFWVFQQCWIWFWSGCL